MSTVIIALARTSACLSTTAAFARTLASSLTNPSSRHTSCLCIRTARGLFSLSEEAMRRLHEKTPCWRANVCNCVCRVPVHGIMLRSADNPLAVCAPQRPFYPSSPRAVQLIPTTLLDVTQGSRLAFASILQARISDRSHLWPCRRQCAPASVLAQFSGLAPLTSMLWVALLYDKLSKPS